MNAIAVAVSKLPQWFSAQMFRSLSIKTVMPADEHAAPKISAAVIPSPIANRQTARRFRRQRLTSNAYISTMASEKLHRHCNMVAATR